MSYQLFLKRFLLIIAIITLLGLLWFIRDTVMTAFLATVIAVGLSIPTRMLTNRGMKRGWAIGVSVTGFLIVLSFAVLLIVPSLVTGITDLVTDIPAAANAALDAYSNLRQTNDLLGSLLPEFDPSSFEITEDIAATIQELIQSILSTAAPAILQGIGTVSSVAFDLFILFFIFLFFLIEPKVYVKASLYLVPQRYQQRLLDLWNELYVTLTLWFKAQFTSIAITVFLVWFVLGVLLGMPNALTVAIFSGVATFIPNIGAVLPAIPIIIFALADDPSSLWYLLLAFLIIQQAEGNIFTPSIVKNELNIPSGALMLFQIVFTTLFGFLGLLLAIPLMATMIAIVREVYSYGFLGLREAEIELQTTAQGELLLAGATPAVVDPKEQRDAPVVVDPKEREVEIEVEIEKETEVKVDATKEES